MLSIVSFVVAVLCALAAALANAGHLDLGVDFQWLALSVLFLSAALLIERIESRVNR